MDRLLKQISCINCTAPSKKQVDIVNGEIHGAILQNRYMIEGRIDNGSFGQVYKVRDLKMRDRNLIIKVSTHIANITREINAIERVKTLEIVSTGLFKQYFDDKVANHKYFIMPNYGQNLDSLMTD